MRILNRCRTWIPIHLAAITFTCAFFATIGQPPTPAGANTRQDDCVILLHGLGRTSGSMKLMENFLKDYGYLTINNDYPSTSLSIEKISDYYLPRFIAECGKRSRRIHVVTHSLGGIIFRHYLQEHRLPQGSRIVMLSPPNKGSEVADRFKDQGWYRQLMGPAGQQLTTAPDSLPNRLEPIDYEVGVITGRRTLEPWFSWMIPGEDDGKVSVARARLAEMKDFLVVNHGHTFIMNSHRVKEQVVHFLEHGYFQRSVKKDNPMPDDHSGR